jgi:hypothetical protein
MGKDLFPRPPNGSQANQFLDFCLCAAAAEKSEEKTDLQNFTKNFAFA